MHRGHRSWGDFPRPPNGRRPGVIKRADDEGLVRQVEPVESSPHGNHDLVVLELYARGGRLPPIARGRRSR